MDLHPLASSELYRELSWPELKSSLWLRTGFVSASAALIGALMFLTGTTSSPVGLIWAVGGVLGAVWSWRRAWVLLSQVDAADALSRSPEVERSAGRRVTQRVGIDLPSAA